jgi:hypothetical protein
MAHPHVTPVAIVAYPDASPLLLLALAQHAMAQQHAPLVLHTFTQPWWDPDEVVGIALRPQAEVLLHTLGRHTGARLWVLLRPGEQVADAPPWLAPWLRAWRRAAGTMPSRIRSGHAAAWRQAGMPAPGTADG